MDIRTQKYAEKAYPLVADMRAKIGDGDYNTKRELEADYRTQALNLPTMILQSGLAQTVGFLMAKSKSNNKVSKNDTENADESSVSKNDTENADESSVSKEDTKNDDKSSICKSDAENADKSSVSNDNPFDTLLKHLESLLSDELQEQSLHDKVIKSNLTEYQILTRKALEASSWLKRYTQARLRKKGDKDD